MLEELEKHVIVPRRVEKAPREHTLAFAASFPLRHAAVGTTVGFAGAAVGAALCRRFARGGFAEHQPAAADKGQKHGMRHCIEAESVALSTTIGPCLRSARRAAGLPHARPAWPRAGAATERSVWHGMMYAG